MSGPIISGPNSTGASNSAGGSSSGGGSTSSDDDSNNNAAATTAAGGQGTSSPLSNFGGLSMEDAKPLNAAHHRYRQTQAARRSATSAQIAAAGIEPDLDVVMDTINGLLTPLPRSLTDVSIVSPGGTTSPHARTAKRLKVDEERGDAESYMSRPRKVFLSSGTLGQQRRRQDDDGDEPMTPLSPVSAGGPAPALPPTHTQQPDGPLDRSVELAIAAMRSRTAVMRAVPRPRTLAAHVRSLALGMATAATEWKKLGGQDGDDDDDDYGDDDKDLDGYGGDDHDHNHNHKAVSNKVKYDKCGFDLLASLCTCPDVLIETFKYLRPGDIVTVYSVSRDVYDMLRINMQTCIIAWSRCMAPQASRVFSGPLYFKWLIRDPLERAREPASATRQPCEAKNVTRGDGNGDRKGENGAVRCRVAAPTRTVPGLIWLTMVEQRQWRTQDIMACLARRGHRLPPGSIMVLMKIWLLMDISSSAVRMRLLNQYRLMSDEELVVAQLFMTKLLMCFNDPIYGPASSVMVELFMGQRGGLSPLWALLRRKYCTSIEMARLRIRYDIGPSPEQLQAGQPVLGIPVYEMGKDQYEGWGVGANHLLRPDELVMIESARRGIHTDAHIEALMAYGHFDFATGESLVPSLEEMYIDDVYLTWADKARNSALGYKKMFILHQLMAELDDDDDDDRDSVAAAAAIANAGCGNVPFYPGEWEPRYVKKARWETLDERERGAILKVDAAEKSFEEELETGKDEMDDITHHRSFPPDLSMPFGNMAKNFSLAAAMRDLSLDPLVPGNNASAESSEDEDGGGNDLGDIILTDMGPVRPSEVDDGAWFLEATSRRGGGPGDGTAEHGGQEDGDGDVDDDRSSVGSEDPLDTVFDPADDKSLMPVSRSSSGAYTVATSLDLDEGLAAQADADYSDDELEFDWDVYVAEDQNDGDEEDSSDEEDLDEDLFGGGGGDDDDSDDDGDGDEDDDSGAGGAGEAMNLDGDGSGEKADDTGSGQSQVQGPEEEEEAELLRHWYRKF